MAKGADLAQFDDLPDSAFVRVGTVCRLYSITPATAWRWAREGNLPPPRKLGPQVTAWQVGELRRKLASAEAA